MALPKRLPGPVVLAAASGMVCIGVVAIIVSSGDAEGPAHEPIPTEDPSVIIDDTTPERAAESFLDAWRKREHEAAKAISVGDAHHAVVERQLEDERLTPEEREIKEQVWDTMAEGRLQLLIEQSDDLTGRRIALRGTAEGEFLGRPYVRRISFVLQEHDDGWRVESMDLGEIVSEVPDFLDLDGLQLREDPSEFEMRGEDVP